MIVETKFGVGKNYRDEGFRLLNKRSTAKANEKFGKAEIEYKGCEEIVTEFISKHESLPQNAEEKEIRSVQNDLKMDMA